MQKNYNANVSVKNKKFFSYQLYGMVLLLVMLLIALTTGTIAWFKDESTTSNGDPHIMIIGTIDLNVTTNFNFFNLSLAPDNIYTTDKDNADIGTYVNTISGSHNIDGAYVRIKFTNTRVNQGTSTEIDNSDLLTLYFTGNTTTNSSYTESSTSVAASDKNKWYLHTDNYYYYIGNVYNDPILFNAGYQTSNYMTNVEAGADVNLTFEVEAIQRQYGAYLEEWPTAPQIFKTYAKYDTAVDPTV